MSLGTPLPFAATTLNTLATALTLTLPASIPNSSAAFMLVGVNSVAGTNAISTPSGWTLASTGQDDIPTFGNESIVLLKRAVDAVHSNSTVNVTVSGGTIRLIGGGFIPGASTTLDVAIGRFYGTSETSATLTAPSQTPATADAMQVILMMRRWAAGATPTTTTPPSGFTEISPDTNVTTNTTGSIFGFWGAYKQLTGQAGVAQGTKTVTLDTASDGHGYIITVKPAVVVTPPTATATTSSALVIDARGSTAGAGGALTYSIAQTGGVAETPTVQASGLWLVTRHATSTRTYTVTVTEGAQTGTTVVSVNPSTDPVDAVEYLRRVSGAWV